MTGLEPATSGVTGQRSNQLSYTPIIRSLPEFSQNLRDVTASPQTVKSHDKRNRATTPPPGGVHRTRSDPRLAVAVSRPVPREPMAARHHCPGSLWHGWPMRIRSRSRRSASLLPEPRVRARDGHGDASGRRCQIALLARWMTGSHDLGHDDTARRQARGLPGIMVPMRRACTGRGTSSQRSIVGPR